MHSVVKNRKTTPIWAPIGPCSKPTETNQETDHFLACNCWNKTYMTKDYRHSFRTKSEDWSSNDATMSELVYTWYSGNFQVKINKWYRKCQVSRKTAPTNSKSPPKSPKADDNCLSKISASNIFNCFHRTKLCMSQRPLPRIKSRSQTRASHTNCL